MAANTKQPYKRAIVAGVAGNLMEWYDFAIYGYMVPVISVLFFPSEDPVASIIATFSAFAAGYFARPVGGIIFGYIGDRYGRKLVLVLSVSLMGLSTFSMGPVAGSFTNRRHRRSAAGLTAHFSGDLGRR